MRREEGREVRQAGLLAADEVAERGGRLAIGFAEDVSPTVQFDDALVDVHRAARRLRQRLGHAHHDQAVLERDLLEQVLEQEGLVGQQDRVAMQEVDLELAGAHLVHEGVAHQAQRIHAAVDVLEERPQAVVGRHAEGRIAQLAPAIRPQRGLERLVGIGVRGEDEELQFGGHHRLPAVGGVARHHLLEQAAGGQPGRRAIQFLRIADGEGARSVAPGQAMDLGRLGDQRQVAIVAAIEARRRVAAHDALQQHATGELQAPAAEEALAGHHLAARHPVEVGGDAFDFFNSSQPFGE
ncbi:hypothetical protein PAERUG_E16_London_17_VIM_2_04_14_02118 [Pseudomonas aeruginosa]|nr:hypothetical protein PAERUG_E16_London_17_VIM_2_04_14_02118 [Pseudomonas aeruginosa]